MAMTELTKPNPAAPARGLFEDMRSEMAQMGRWVDRMLARPFPASPLVRWMENGTSGTMYPSVDVWEKDDRIEVMAEVPGYALEDIHLHATDEGLAIEGERRSTEPEKDGEAHQRMGVSSAGSFRIALRLPCGIDPARTEAKLTHGILRVNLPKIEPGKSEGKEIRIRSGD